MHIPPKKAEESERNLRDKLRHFPHLKVEMAETSTSAENQNPCPVKVGPEEWFADWSFRFSRVKHHLYAKQKKPILKKMPIFVFSDFFCLGCLNSMKELSFFCETMWKAVKQWFFLTSSPGWSLRGDPKRPPASVAKPQTPHVTSMVAWRREDGDASEALGSRNQWRTGSGKICKNMMAIWITCSNFVTFSDLFCGECCQAPARELRW